MKPTHWSPLVLLGVLPLVLGSLSGFLSNDAISGWYTTLAKPAFHPPNWIFGPVWTILYIMMGWSLVLLLQSTHREKPVALIFFVLQLLANIIWSPIFFTLQSPDLALVVIISMLILIILTMVSAFRVRPLAGYLLIPYLLWVSFATVLNWNIVILN